jgi:Phosphotransferase enzyme family
MGTRSKTMPGTLTTVPFTCVKCGSELKLTAEQCTCCACRASWPCLGGIPRFFEPEAHDLSGLSIRRQIERCLSKHPLLGAWDLEFVGTHCAKASEVLEYRRRKQPQAQRLMIKHRTVVISKEESESEVSREFRIVEDLWTHAGEAFQATIPRPVALLPEAGAAVYERVPGTPMTTVLKRYGNRLTGPFERKRMSRIANWSGKWLRSFHELNAGPSIPHDAQSYLAKLAHWLGKDLTAGLDVKAASSIWDAACSSAERARGQVNRYAGVHGDFIPQNIFVQASGVAVIDFASFRKLDVVYEDLAFFVAACRLMASRSVYSRPVAIGMAHAFLEGYGDSLNADLFDLYTLKATAMILADQFTPSRPSAAEAKKVRRIRTQLATETRRLLAGRVDEPSAA